jgi:tripartite-type tricarboxylate transporter receptor subunit TctC
MPQVKSGKVKALAVTGAKRLQAFPDIPTVAEGGFPGFEVTAWYGLYGPAGMPADVVALLHRDVVRILADPDVQSKFEGAEATPSASPADLRNRLANEVSRWEQLLKMPEFAAGMQ